MQQETKEKIKKLIEKYEVEKNSGKLRNYTEQETKLGFIEPLFEILGWDFHAKNEVSAEESIASSGRVDYGFYLNDRVKFYLEAKSFKADIHDQKFANQAIRYSFNKGTVWALLTNFETLIIFNAQNIKGVLSDKRVFTIHYNEYVEKFDKLWLLSKEAFKEDLLDKYADEIGKKIEKVSVTSLLYKDLQECRNILIKYLGAWNDKVESDLLDEGIQKLLDRLIFIRVAEDRDIEKEPLISMVRQARNESGEYLYQAMVKKFRDLDSVYNSNLFTEHPFEQWQDIERATEKVIRILYGKEGYYEYDFKAMPADVLGAVYENYLSHRLSKSKKGTTLSKDAGKRKEQGIYYTPSYIVDYIVKNALGPVLDKCKTIEDIKKIKVLDPACGSGSFLIKAFEVIVEKYKDFGFRGREDLLKIQILEENIYGVDLDQQAVEITRLNLLINALTEREKLPFLDNIKNGNSLISGTDEELEKYFGKSFRDKKPFNWQEQFPEVFKQGGFDVVIGNPPYVNLANIDNKQEREYLKKEYQTAKNKSDLYSFFIERAINILKPAGNLGFIISNSWLGTDSFSKFREYLVDNTSISQMVELPLGVFEQATVTPVLIFLSKFKVSPNHKIQIFKFQEGRFKKVSSNLSYERIIKSPSYNFSFNPEIEIKIPTVKLGDIADLSLGVKTSNDKKFILDKKIDNNCHKLLRGKDVSRYFYKYADKWLWYKPELMMQKVGAGPRHIEYFLRNKILFRNITGGSIIATLDENKYLTNDKVNILYQIKDYSLKFILGVVNSKVINFWIRATFNNLLEIKINQLQNIPIPKINFSDKTEKIKHDELTKLTERILKLNQDLQKFAENSEKWNSIKSEIEKTDKKIDQEVYKLYGLTEEEIKIIEGK